MSVNDKKYCSNCGQNIEATKFFLHERMCSMNVKKCPKCNKPFTIEDLEEHINDAHTEGECEFCKKKFPKIDLENHKNKCDHKMVPCKFCELEVLLGELKDHQKSCGAITEPCPECGRYVQRKDLENHLLQGCPPPKNDRRSVDVIHNSNSKIFLDNYKKNNTNIYNNYNPINDLFSQDVFIEDNKGKIDIKTHANNKPNLQIRPASGKKILNENAKKNSILGNNYINNSNNLNIINNKKEKNNNISNKTKIDKDKKNVKTGKTGKTTTNNKNNNNNKFNSYMNKQNSNKEAIPLIPITNNNNIASKRYPDNKTNVKKSNKPAFASNLSKTSLNSNLKSSRDKTSDEEFRKSREKFTFQNAKNLEKHLNKEVKNVQVLNKKKGVINEDDYIENFNFGDVEDQLMQRVLEESLKQTQKK